MKSETNPRSHPRILSFIPNTPVMIKTSIDHKRAIDLVGNSISPVFHPLFGTMPRHPQNFQGQVSETGFRIRVSDPVRSSLTWVVGTFIPDGNGLKVYLYVEPNPLFLIGLVVGLLIALIGLVVTIITGNYFLFLGGTVCTIFFGAAHIIETETLDWFIGNIFNPYIDNVTKTN